MANEEALLGAIKANSPVALSPAEIEAKSENLGLGKVKNSIAKNFVLAMLAGAFIGMGAMFFLLITSDKELPFAIAKVMGSVAFVTGLYLVITAGSELFTGDCLMITSVLGKKITVNQMLKVWGVVWIGNLVGSVLFALLLYLSHFGGLNGDLVAQNAINVAASKSQLALVPMFFKGILCNVLVCFAVWCSFGAKSTADKLLSVLFPIAAFVACGFEHSVANMFFLNYGFIEQIFTGMAPASGNLIQLSGIATNLTVVTVANIVGGAIFVGCAYFYTYHKK